MIQIIFSLKVYFRAVQGFHFPQNLEIELKEVTPSLVNLAWTMQAYGLIIGALDRHQSRFLDVHCYDENEVDYDHYWSAAEQTLTQSDVESFV